MSQLGSCRVCGRGEQAEVWCVVCQTQFAAQWQALVNPAPDTATPEEAFRRDRAIRIAVTSAIWTPVQYGVIEDVRER